MQLRPKALKTISYSIYLSRVTKNNWKVHSSNFRRKFFFLLLRVELFFICKKQIFWVIFVVLRNGPDLSAAERDLIFSSAGQTSKKSWGKMAEAELVECLFGWNSFEWNFKLTNFSIDQLFNDWTFSRLNFFN